jgi:glycosyltransferase involved in cell wall biosynthesis
MARPADQARSWESRQGAAALAPVDLEQAAIFEATYANRPSVPVAIVMAAYNEGASVATVVADAPQKVCGFETEVIVVVDGASDNTAEAAASGGALVCDVPVNRGQGAALRLGYHLARERGATYIITSDADGQYGSDDMDRVLGPIVADRADFVSGSRRLGSTDNDDPVRNTGVVVFAALISLLIRQKITDPACGLRAMRAGVTASMVLEQPQYQASELEIGVAMAGYRITEVPISMKKRRSGKTKKGGNFIYGVRFTSVVVGTWWRERGRRSTKTQRS